MKKVDLTNESQDKIRRALSRTPFFGSLDERIHNEIIAQSELVLYEEDEKMVNQGDESEDMLIIVKGNANILIEQLNGDLIRVGTVGPGQSIGEMGLLLNQARSANVVSTSSVLALKISRIGFQQLAQDHAQLSYQISLELAERLEKRTQSIPLPAAIETETPDQQTLSMLPYAFIQRHRVLPLTATDQSLTVGFVDPLSPKLLGRIKSLLPSLDIKPSNISLAFFNRSIQAFSGISETAMTQHDDDDPMPDALRNLLERAVSEGVSDLHLNAGYKPRWRLDGDIVSLEDLNTLGKETVYDLIKPLMRPKLMTEFEESGDADFSIALSNSSRFRVNLFRDTQGIGAVLRQIPSKIMTAGQLGLPSVTLKLAQLPKGLVLVTGATGSGKSTTLASMVDYLNRNQKSHILTLEDPVEFVHTSQKSLVTQREIGLDSRNFHTALRAALRQDPDIVMVGELRDLETIELALEVANTGHLVFGTLHTTSAIATIDRVVNIFPEGQQNQIRATLGEVLKGVISQTLLKRKSGGRVAAIEVMVVNKAIENLIKRSNNSQIVSAMQTGKAQGNKLMNESLAELVSKGVVTFDEALSKCMDRKDLARRCNKPYAE